MSTPTPGTPATPGTPVTPAASTAPRSTASPTMKRAEEYFNSSRLKVIGLITAATVAVGALGGIAGVVFDPDPIQNKPSLNPGGANGSVGSPGKASPRGASKPLDLTGFTAPGALPEADTSESPSEVGSVSPGDGGLSTSPSDESTDASSEPSPTDNGTGGDTGDGGQGVNLSATNVDVYVPSGWEVLYQDDSQVTESDNAGSFVTAFSTTVDPSVSASDIITQNLADFLPADTYTQLQTGDVQDLQPFGSVVSVAGIPYQALWADNQGSVSVAGQLYVGVRQDGVVLLMFLEHVPAEEWDSASDGLLNVLNATFARFGGVG